MINAQYQGFLKTPALWKGEQFGIQQFEFPTIDLASFQARPIPSNLRLGHRIEHIFRQLVEHSKSHTIVLSNLPIRQKETTIGEIDFILRDNVNNKLIHVELTYKFYLILPDLAEPVHRLIGPNKRDTFFRKTEKIRNKQFPLLHTADGARALNEHGIDPLTIEHQCCFKAQLFQPYRKPEMGIGSMNEDCLAGHWLGLDDFNRPLFAEALFYAPTKSEWVIAPHEQVIWKEHSEILEEIRQSHFRKMAPMLWVKRADGTIEKLFVVWW